ncbi:MAG: glycosyltransferase [Lachnospiraceae bacterium]|nr:glycosyltransferase [Lachnospiraceae bacterium]
MNNVYNSYFFNEFYQENGGGNYTDEKLWTPFFEHIADKIVEIFAPETVLDAGCACGYLVAALRDRGVKAFGIDISEYAIGKARKDIRPYLNVQSIAEKLPKNFPEKFDLAVTIEVMEHLFPEEGKKAIGLLCDYADAVIFTSTPTDIEDKTHVNVQQKEYWAKLFAEQSFYRDLYQPVDFICGWAMLFRKREDVSKVIFEYELSSRVDSLKQENGEKEEKKELLKCYYQLEGQEGFSENYCKTIYFTLEQKNFSIDIREEKPVTGLRIDPVESTCIVKHFHVYDLLDDRNELEVKVMNGIRSGSRIIFGSDDPMAELEVPKNDGVVRLEVCFEVEACGNQQILNTFHILSGERQFSRKMESEHKKEIKEMEEKHTAVKKELEAEVLDFKEKYTELEQEKRTAEWEMEQYKKEQEREMTMLTEDLIKKLDLYKEEQNNTKELYESGIQKLTEKCEALELEKKRALQEQLEYLKEKEVLGVKLEEILRQKKELEERFLSEQNKYVAEREELRNKMDVLYEEVRTNKEKCQVETTKLSRENEIQKLHLTALEKQKKELEEKFQKIKTEYENENKKLRIQLEKLEKEQEELVKEKAELGKKVQEILDDKKKKEEEIQQVAENKLNELQEQLEYYTQHYQASMNQRAELQAQLDHYMLHYQTAINQREDLAAQNREIQRQRDEYKANYTNVAESYLAVTDSTCWKITSPLRKIMDFFRGNKSQENSVKSACIFRPEELEAQRKEVFTKDIKFSILVPLYNTPLNFLNEMIQSVTGQTYANWELCLADGSDDEHKEVKSEVLKLAKKDKRIKYKKLKENKGISENTNECIEMADGDYIVLFDHDDVLHPSALYEVMKAICNQNADFIYTDENTFSDRIENAYWPHYKPDFSPDTLRSYNYICHLSVFKKELLEKAGGGFRKEFDGSQDYDMVLRLTEVAEHIVHIPKVLYYWRAHKNSVASDISAKPYTLTAAKKALAEHLERVGLKGEVCDAKIPSTYQIKYEITGKPLISIIIPNKDHIDDLDKCIQSVEKKSTYRHFEIIVVENNSTESETMEYYKKIQRKYKNIKVVTWREGFNYSKINNFGFKYAKGDYIVLLNNDIEILTPDWLEQMLMYTQRKEVGAAGMMLYYPDDTIQHAGVILGIGGVAGHSHKYFKRGDYGYASRLCIAQNLSAVTAASMMIRSDVYKQIGGLDEGFAVAFNDVDLCMKIREAGYLIVWTPYAEAYHYESKSRGFEDTPEKQERFKGEIDRFMDKWGETLKKGDPYYNMNLTLVREDFGFK